MLPSPSSEITNNNQQQLVNHQQQKKATRRLGLSSGGSSMVRGECCWINSTFYYSDESFIVNDDEEDHDEQNMSSSNGKGLLLEKRENLDQGDHVTESNMMIDTSTIVYSNHDENLSTNSSNNKDSTTRQHINLDELTSEIHTSTSQTDETLKTTSSESRQTSLYIDDLNDHHSHMMQLVKGVDATVARYNFNLAPSNLPDQHYLHHYIPENDDSLSTTKVRTLSDQGSEFSSERGDVDNECWFFNTSSNVNDSYFLPDELIYKILTYLDFDDVVLKSSLVNRQFFSVSNCGGFWIQFIKTRKCEDTVNILSYYQYEFHSNNLTKQIKHEQSEELTNDDTTAPNTDNSPNTPSDEIVIPSEHSNTYDPANHLTIYRPILLSYLYHKRNLKKWFFITEANYYLLFLLPFGVMTFLFLSSYVFPVFPPFYKLNLFSFSTAPSKFFSPSRRNIYIEGIGENFSQWTLGIFGLSILVIIISLLLIRPLTTAALKYYYLTIQNEDQLSFTKSIITKTKSDYSSLIPHSIEMLPVSLRKKLVRDILGHEKLFTKEHVVRSMVLIPVLLCYITTVLKNFVYIPYLSESYHTLLSLPGYLILVYLIKRHWYMVFKIHGFFSLLVCYACFHFLLNQLKWDVLIRPMFYFLSQVFGVWCYIILNFWVLGGPDNTQGIPCANN